jgi:hypothetical protein
MQAKGNRGIIIELLPKGSVDFSKVIEDYANGRPVDLTPYDVHMCGSIIDDFRAEFLDYIEKHGLTSYLRREMIEEAIVPPKQPRNQVEELVKRFIQEINVTDELIVVDPYFFAATRDAAYPSLIESVLQPVLPTLTNIDIVTLAGKVDSTVKTAIIGKLTARNKTTTISHVTSNAFHDRFWINPQAMKGFVMGTSLNGLGKRYALLDHLQQSDVKEVIDALAKESLI